jgi:MFS family permease
LSQVRVQVPSTPERSGAVRSALATAFSLDLLTALIVFAFSNSYLVQVLHAPPSYPAFAMGVWGAVKLISSPPGGWVADHLPGGWAGGLAAAAHALGILIMLFSGTGEGYIIGMAPLAAGSTLAWLLIFRALGEHVDAPGRAEASARMTIVAATGLSVGFAVAAFVAEQQERHAGFYAGLIVTAAMTLPMIRASQGLQAPEHVRSERRSWRTLAGSRSEGIIAAVTLIHFIAFSGIVVVLGPFTLDLLGLRVVQVGFLGLPAVLAALAALWLAGKRSRNGRRLWEVGALYIIGGAALVASAGLSSTLLFGVLMVLLGVSIGGSSPLLSALRIDVSLMDPRPGAVLGRLSFFDGLGAALGPFIAGVTITFGGVRLGMVVVGLAFAVTGLLAWAGAKLERL